MKTKHTLLLIALTLLSFSAVRAQVVSLPMQHEVSASIGFFPNTKIIESFSTFLKETDTSYFKTWRKDNSGTIDSVYHYGEASTLPAISLEYLFHYSEKSAFGILVVYNHVSRDISYKVTSDDKNVNYISCGQAKRSSITLMPSIKYSWYSNDFFTFYSKGALGVTLFFDNIDNTQSGKSSSDFGGTFNYQLSLVGAEIGWPQARFFVEGGTGEQGCIVAGLRCHF